MTEATTRFALPFILPGQAQKELFHNEALLLVDGLLHPAAESGPLAAPPAEPEPGQCWIVAPAPSAAWSGHANELAVWTDGGWRFAPPVPGMSVWIKPSEHWLHWNGVAWIGSLPATGLVVAGQQVVGSRQPAIASPSGGTIIDEEARAAIDTVIVALKSHGLID